jgi:putative PIN family toxin of toxin-antitoxin system
MGAQESLNRRVVFDTNTVISALLFANGRLAWLRQHWREGGCVPLASRSTAAELTRVLRYPKFRLSTADALELLSEYLPHCQVIEPTERCASICRDANDQPFLDLAQSGGADLLVSGDQGLLTLNGQTMFPIETPEAYRRRTFEVR